MTFALKPSASQLTEEFIIISLEIKLYVDNDSMLYNLTVSFIVSNLLQFTNITFWGSWRLIRYKWVKLQYSIISTN